MTLTRWLRSVLAPRHTSARKRPRTRRLAVEALEDRLTPSTGGVLDPTFGSGGVVTSSFTNYIDEANAVTVQPDGKIVIAGLTLASGSKTADDFLVARYNADGSVDTSFGSGGHTATDFGSIDYAEAVALQPQSDGTDKILAAGLTDSSKKGSSYDLFALARYNANGTLDTTFGSKGKVTTDMGGSVGWAESMVVDSSGRIVVAGTSGGVAALARYNANGTLDTTFGSGGKVVTSISILNTVKADALALQADGKIVIAGSQYDSTLGADKFVTARFNANGALDTTFGSGGVVSTYVGGNDGFGALAVQGDGKILVAGWEGRNVPGGDYLLRYNTDGTLDTGFGSGGVVTLMNPSGWHTASGDMVAGVAVQSDGEIVVGGQLYDSVAQTRHFVAVRVGPTGAVDTGYGNAGWASAQFGYGDASYAMVLGPDGRLLLAGTVQPTSGGPYPTDIALVRFLGSAPQIGSFTASPNPVTAGSNVTLTASNITDGNPTSTVTQVTFYYFDSNGNKVTLGTGTQTSPGAWTYTFPVSLASGSYTLYAQAEDSDGVSGDPFALTLQVS